VVGHLVDADLVSPGADLEEEVVQQVEREVARVEDVIALPRLAERVGHGRGLALELARPEREEGWSLGLGDSPRGE